MNYGKTVSPAQTLLLVALMMAAGVSSTGAAAQSLSTVSGSIPPSNGTTYPAYALTDPYFTFTFDFCAIDRPAHLVRQLTLASPLTLKGMYSFSDIPGGKYNVYLKGAICLRTVKYLDTTTNDALPFDFQAAPGDCSQNNQCDPTAFGILALAYNTDSSVPGGGYDARADLDYNGIVDPTDFGLFVGNYNTAGEAFATNLTIKQMNVAPTLTWEAASPAEEPYKFRIYRATKPNSTSATMIADNYPSLSFPDTDKTLDKTGQTTYYYRVTAKNQANEEGLPSNEVAFKVKSLFRDIPAPNWAAVVPMDSGGAGGTGPSAADSVNLTSGVYENNPDPDIVVRNPNGPDAMYARSYHTGRAAAGYHSPGLPPGWTDNYDVTIGFDANSNISLRYPNGAADSLTPNGNNTFAAPSGAPYSVTGTLDPNTNLYTQFALLSADLSKMVFTPDPRNIQNPPFNYLLTEMDNLLGQKIVIIRDPTTGQVMKVTDGVNNLLTITPSGATMIAQDVPGQRSVQYTFGVDPNAPNTTELLSVSRITPDANRIYVTQYAYQYKTTTVGTLMSGVKTQSPSSTDANVTMSNAITYDDGGIVTMLTDANGNTRNYAVGDSSTTVTIPDAALADPANPSPETWMEVFSGNKVTGDMDALKNADTVAYTDRTAPYLPTEFTNKNNQKSTMSYEQAPNGGLYGNISVTNTPINYGPNFAKGNLQTVTTYDYTISALGLPKQVDQTGPDGTRTLAKIFYYPNGQVQTIQTPQPGAVGSFVTTTYEYNTPLKNVSKIMEPGPGLNGYSVAYTFGYTDNGKTEALGEPTHVTDPLGHTTSYFYDGRGNVTSVILPSISGAAGYRTDYYYNNADQLVQATYPATGQTGPITGRACTRYNYYYEGGGLQSVQIFNEGDSDITKSGARVLVREIDNTPGNEGEIKQVANAVPTVSSKYDPQYRLKQLTDGNAHTTKHSYDAVGNLNKMTYPGGKSLSATFDADHNATSATNARSQQTSLALAPDDSGVMGVSYPAGTLPPVAYVYDGFGRLTSDDNGVVKQTYTYDDADNLLNKIVYFEFSPYDFVYSGDSNYHMMDMLTYAYNSDGSVTSMSSVQIGKTTYQYDDAGNFKRVDYPWRDTYNRPQYAFYTYDEDDRLTKQTTTAIITTYAYNARSQRLSLDNEAVTAITTALVQSAGGGLEQIGDGSSLVAKYSAMKYDGAGNLLGYNAAYQNWKQLFPRNYSFNGTYAYAYDSKDRLINENVTRPSVASSLTNTAYTNACAPDDANNLTTVRPFVGITYNADNQIDGNPNYDTDGNLQSVALDEVTLCPYDVENRLLGTPQTTPVGYDSKGQAIRNSMGYYDDGRRAFNLVPAELTVNSLYDICHLYVYDGSRLLYEIAVNYGAFGAIVTETDAYGWGAAGINQKAITYPTNTSGTSSVYQYAFDPQGSPVNSYEAYNNWADLRFYDAYGQMRNAYVLNHNYGNPAHSGPRVLDPVGFGGQWGYYTDYASQEANFGNDGSRVSPLYSTTGLVLLGHRYYDPLFARFVSRDPIGYEGGINLYAYCGNNPVGFADPDGTGPLAILRNWAGKAKRFVIGFGKGAANSVYPDSGHRYLTTLITPDNYRKFLNAEGKPLFDVGTSNSEQAGAFFGEAAGIILPFASGAGEAEAAEAIVPRLSRNARRLLNGEDIEVKSIREADNLIREALPNAKKVQGAGPKAPNFAPFKGKNSSGMYHKDYLVDPATGRVYGHGPTNPHGAAKHINVKLPDGTKVVIRIRPKR